MCSRSQAFAVREFNFKEFSECLIQNDDTQKPGPESAVRMMHFGSHRQRFVPIARNHECSIASARNVVSIRGARLSR
jgi:hypothetical protein